MDRLALLIMMRRRWMDYRSLVESPQCYETRPMLRKHFELGYAPCAMAKPGMSKSPSHLDRDSASNRSGTNRRRNRDRYDCDRRIQRSRIPSCRIQSWPLASTADP